MKFYTKTHQYYCGVDLHTKTQYLCILDQSGTVVLHKNLPNRPQAFLKAIQPFRENLVVGIECIFSWYWLADLCAREQIAFILGHALYMKAIHGGKAKSDKIDSEKIARLIKGGTFPLAYTYPPELRPVRDLLRRRRMLVRHRSEVLAHLKWAFSEATALFMRESQQAKDYVEKLSVKHGKGKAMSILAHKLGRAVYFVIKRKDAFDVNYFFTS